MAFDCKENMSNVNTRKIVKYCDLGFVIPYVKCSLGPWSNDNSIRRVRNTQKKLEIIKKELV